jgi:hypothetical protein
MLCCEAIKVNSCSHGDSRKKYYRQQSESSRRSPRVRTENTELREWDLTLKLTVPTRRASHEGVSAKAFNLPLPETDLTEILNISGTGGRVPFLFLGQCDLSPESCFCILKNHNHYQCKETPKTRCSFRRILQNVGNVLSTT